MNHNQEIVIPYSHFEEIILAYVRHMQLLPEHETEMMTDCTLNNDGTVTVEIFYKTLN